MININRVRNTVMFMLNKENRGYITPNEFNSYANLAQMAIFEDDFSRYAKAISLAPTGYATRQYHSEYADMPKMLRERIDELTEIGDMVDAGGGYVSVDASDVYRLTNIDYHGADVEEVSKLELNRLLSNSLIAPSTQYPIYVTVKGRYKVYPITIPVTDLSCVYVKKPAEPKWTYTIISGNPMYNPSATDRQDFELHASCETELVIKILGYCGLSIREDEIVKDAHLQQQMMDIKDGNLKQ